MDAMSGSTTVGYDKLFQTCCRLLALAPDAVLANGNPSLSAFKASARRSQSCSWQLAIQSTRAQSKACLDRVATPQVSQRLNLA